MATTASTSDKQTAPGPRGNFLLGSLPDLRRNPLHFYPEMRRHYGDVVRFRGVRGFTWFLVSHPDDIEHVLKSKHYPKGLAIEMIRVLIGNGLLTSTGEFWRKQRRLAQPAFHRQRLANLSTMMTAAAETLGEQLAPAAKRGHDIDIASAMMRLTLEIVGRALFSVDISAAASSVGEAVTIALDHVNHRGLDPFSLPERIPTPRNRRFLRAKAQLDALVYRIIDQRLRSGEDTGDLLSMLLSARDEETGAGMSPTQLRDEIITLILAGHETTAVTLSWTWYLLAQHPEVERSLHAELAAVLAGRTPTIDDLPKLPYTRMVIDEVLRLYPPAWVIARQTTEDDELGGFTVPAKSVIMLSQYVTQRHPSFWPEPDAFDPLRFTPERSAARPRFAYFPFGGGPRICIGNSFALVEAQLLLATLAQRYRFRLTPGYPVQPEPSVTLRPKYGVRGVLEPRADTRSNGSGPGL